MKKRLKIIQYLILTNSLLLLFGHSCNSNYVKNKFAVTSIFIKKDVGDTCAVVQFHVQYYSDSLYQNLYSSAIERGLDGSDQIISFIESGDSDNNKYLDKEGSSLKSLSDLSSKFNQKEREFIGEQILRTKIICFSKHTDLKNIRLVINNLRKSKIDTIMIAP